MKPSDNHFDVPARRKGLSLDDVHPPYGTLQQKGEYGEVHRPLPMRLYDRGVPVVPPIVLPARHPLAFANEKPHDPMRVKLRVVQIPCLAWHAGFDDVHHHSRDDQAEQHRGTPKHRIIPQGRTDGEAERCVYGTLVQHQEEEQRDGGEPG